MLEIAYDPLWIRASIMGEDIAHFQVRSIHPTDAPLSIAPAGYYAHALPAAAVAAAAGPVAFVDVMLSAEGSCEALIRIPKPSSARVAVDGHSWPAAFRSAAKVASDITSVSGLLFKGTAP